MMTKHKKIIRIKRRSNPNEWVPGLGEELPEDYTPPRTVSSRLKILITLNLYTANPVFFSQILTLWYQGSHCFDCDYDPVYYPSCECEKCEDCKFNRCLCDFKNKPEDIRKITWEFAKLVLYKKDLVTLLNGMKPSNSKLKTSKVLCDILNNNSLLKPLPSYPKYKKIAKELFDL